VTWGFQVFGVACGGDARPGPHPVSTLPSVVSLTALSRCTTRGPLFTPSSTGRRSAGTPSSTAGPAAIRALYDFFTARVGIVSGAADVSALDWLRPSSAALPRSLVLSLVRAPPSDGRVPACAPVTRSHLDRPTEIPLQCRLAYP